jgi:topoisomerase IA-like protein
MENKLGFLGKCKNDISIYVNLGKYGYYINHDDHLYSIPLCFQNNKFNLESAIKIIEYKSKLIKEEKKLENDSTEDIVDIVKNIKNKKPLKKSNE